MDALHRAYRMGHRMDEFSGDPRYDRHLLASPSNSGDVSVATLAENGLPILTALEDMPFMRDKD